MRPKTAEGPARPPVRLMIRYDFGEGKRIGPGKIALLDGIVEHGSISAAGRALGMSYRRAWLLVDELNGLFTVPLVSSKPGGKAGGGARLTPEGETLLKRLHALEARLAEEARTALADMEAMRMPEPPQDER